MLYRKGTKSYFDVTSSSNTGKVFDFNATLPIMVSQLIILMVFLDKTWFGPVGAQLDLREEDMKRKISRISEKNRLIIELLTTSKNLILMSRREYREAVENCRLRNKALNIKILQMEQKIYEKDLQVAIDRMTEVRKVLTPGRLHNTIYSLSNIILRTVLPPGFKL